MSSINRVEPSMADSTAFSKRLDEMFFIGRDPFDDDENIWTSTFAIERRDCE